MMGWLSIFPRTLPRRPPKTTAILRVDRKPHRSLRGCLPLTLCSCRAFDKIAIPVEMNRPPQGCSKMFRLSGLHGETIRHRIGCSQAEPSPQLRQRDRSQIDFPNQRISVPLIPTQCSTHTAHKILQSLRLDLPVLGTADLPAGHMVPLTLMLSTGIINLQPPVQ